MKNIKKQGKKINTFELEGLADAIVKLQTLNQGAPRRDINKAVTKLVKRLRKEI